MEGSADAILARSLRTMTFVHWELGASVLARVASRVEPVLLVTLPKGLMRSAPRITSVASARGNDETWNDGAAEKRLAACDSGTM